MQFYSLRFILFFAVTFVLYYAVSAKYRKYVVFISSSVFIFSFDAVTFIIAFVSASLFYVLGYKIADEKPERRGLYIIPGIIYSVVLLIIFKYESFISQSSGITLNILNVNSGIKSAARAVGMSFYLFSGISYLIEVRRKNVIPEKNFVNFFNFISFFPKFISGPIERPQKLLKQLSFESAFDYSIVTNGIKLAVYGFFLKLVAADLLGRLSDPVFNSPELFNGLFTVTGVIFFSLQIYFDFSGYTYIALGTSQMLGINLTDNFNRPYFSQSVSEFWSRWHITLSQWVRDYIFLPVAYKIARVKTGFIKPENLSYVAATLISMAIIGIWHGAGWTFIIWGILHGGYMVSGFITRKARRKFKKISGFAKFKMLNNVLSVILTFLLVSFAWIFFRALDFNNAISVVWRFGSGWNTVFIDFSTIKGYLFYIGYSKTDVAMALLSLLFIFVLETSGGINAVLGKVKKLPGILRWVIYYIIMAVILMFGSFNKIQNFIYQQF